MAKRVGAKNTPPGNAPRRPRALRGRIVETKACVDEVGVEGEDGVDPGLAHEREADAIDETDASRLVREQVVQRSVVERSVDERYLNQRVEHVANVARFPARACTRAIISTTT